MAHKQTNNHKQKRFRITSDDRWGYAFIFFAMVIFLVFTIYPVISAIKTSFLDYKPFGSEYVGWENYADTFHNKLFFKAVKNTVIYTAIVVPATIAITFTLSVMMMAFSKKIQTVFKGIYYLPGIASGVALSVVWLWLYDSSPSGLFNEIMTFLHIPTQNWLNSSKTAMGSLIFMAMVSSHGTNIIIYIAALLGIDKSNFEAAEIDGANFLQKIRYIVIPLVKSTTLFLFITGIINSFQVFMNAYMMTGGGPDNNTTMIGLLIFNNAFTRSEFGLACAQAIIMAIIIAAISFVQFKVMGEDIEY